MPRAKKAKKTPSTVVDRSLPRGELSPLLGTPSYAPQAAQSTLPITSDASATNIPAAGNSPPTPFDIADLPPAKVFPGPLPEGYLNKTATPPRDLTFRANGQPGAPDADGVKAKERIKFIVSDVSLLEGLWQTNETPMMSQKERLGAWLGVATKHLTIWFQNRRQGTKKSIKGKLQIDAVADELTGSAEFTESAAPGIETVVYGPTAVSIAVDGVALDTATDSEKKTSTTISTEETTIGNCVFETPAKEVQHRAVKDPETGRIRPVVPKIPLLTPVQTLGLLAVCNGAYTREMYFADRPEVLPAKSTVAFPLSVTSSLHHVLSERDPNLGEMRTRHRSGESEYRFTPDTIERNRRLLGLLSSDPPSEAVYEDEHERDGDAESGDAPIERSRPTIGMGIPKASHWKANSTNRHLNRATSLNVVAASSRAKELASSALSRSASGYILPIVSERSLGKRAPPGVPMHFPSAAKRARFVGSTYVPGEVLRRNGAIPNYSYIHRDSFSRSTSAAGGGDLSTSTAITPRYTRATSFESTWGSSPVSVGASPVTASTVSCRSIHNRAIGGGTTAVPDGPIKRLGAVVPDANADVTDGEDDADTIEAARCLLSIIGASQSSVSSGSD